MNRSDLINALKEKANLSRKDSEKIVDTFFQTITDTLASGERVEIRGFGSFTVKKYKPYTGRNPKTGVQIRVPAKKLPFFKVGKELKEMVDLEEDE
ncbi:MAG: integration host factor subunit beta [Desulfobacterales bacterium]|nr:integration host factor subunit beta [Desulfobacterales bacterium]